MMYLNGEETCQQLFVFDKKKINLLVKKDDKSAFIQCVLKVKLTISFLISCEKVVLDLFIVILLVD